MENDSDGAIGEFFAEIAGGDSTETTETTTEATTQARERAGSEGETKTEGNGEESRSVQLTAEQYAEFETLQKFAPLVNQLVGGGFGDADAVSQKLTADNERAQLQQDYDAKTDNAFHDLNARVQSGELTPEQAEAHYKRECNLIEREILADQSLRQTQRQALNHQLAAAVEKFPNVKAAGPVAQQMILQLHGVTKQPLETVAEQVNGMLSQAVTKAVTDHETKRAANGRVPAPRGGGAAPGPQGGGEASEDDSWASIFKIK